mgnify:CR=1 FL=1
MLEPPLTSVQSKLKPSSVLKMFPSSSYALTCSCWRSPFGIYLNLENISSLATLPTVISAVRVCPEPIWLKSKLMSLCRLLTFILGRQPYHTFGFSLLHIWNPHHIGTLWVRLTRNRLHINQIWMWNPPFKATMICNYLLVGSSAIFAGLDGQ